MVDIRYNNRMKNIESVEKYNRSLDDWGKKGFLTSNNLKKLVRQALMSCSTGEVDSAVVVRAIEEGEGRDEKRE